MPRPGSPGGVRSSARRLSWLATDRGHPPGLRGGPPQDRDRFGVPWLGYVHDQLRDVGWRRAVPQHHVDGLASQALPNSLGSVASTASRTRSCRKPTLAPSSVSSPAASASRSAPRTAAAEAP